MPLSGCASTSRYNFCFTYYTLLTMRFTVFFDKISFFPALIHSLTTIASLIDFFYNDPIFT